MKVAYVCADRGVPVFGTKGTSNHVQEVIRDLLGRGSSVHLFAVRLGGAAPAGLEPVIVHRLPKGTREDAQAKARSALRANTGLRHGLELAGPFDLVYERHALWTYAAMEYAQTQGTPGLLEVNAPLVEEQRRYRGLVLEPEAREAEARAFAAATAIIGVSDGVAAHLQRHPAARGRVHVVPNGVDPQRFAPQPDGGGRPFTVGFVGTLKPWHGVDDLIDAFAELHHADGDVRLSIVGDGPQRPTLKEKASACGVGRAVEFCGAVAPAEIPSMLARMDVAVAPYPALEDFYFSPLKLFEYMAAGRPIVASAIGQIGQLLSDGETGLLYPPGDTGALASKLARLKADPALRRRLGDAARRVAVRDHTWHSVVSRIFELADAHRPRSATVSAALGKT